MKKIYLSIMAIVLTVGLVSGAAYALFSDTVTVSGLTVSTGNADLVVYDGGTDTLIQNFVSSLNTALVDIYPGWHDYTVMDFSNESLSDIDMSLKGQITAHGGNWEALKDVIQVVVSSEGTYDNPPTTGWLTLDQWSTVARSFGATLGHGTKTPYKFFMRIPSNVGNEISGKSLTINFEFTGTQVSP